MICHYQNMKIAQAVNLGLASFRRALEMSMDKEEHQGVKRMTAEFLKKLEAEVKEFNQAAADLNRG